MAYPQKMFDPKITKAGTELPIMNLQGKPYLQVAHRLVWFREEHPTGIINTELVQCTDQYAVAKATVLLYNETTKQYQVTATGFKKETLEGFPDFIEKSETGAVGRALAMSGYGTQFDPSFDEGDRLADAPVTPAKKYEKKQPAIGAGDSNRADAKPPRIVQAIASNPPAAAPQPSNIEGKSDGGTETPPAPTTRDRKEVDKLIDALARSVGAKKLMSKADIVAHVEKRYGVTTKEALTDEAAQELYQYLDQVNRGKVG